MYLLLKKQYGSYDYTFKSKVSARNNETSFLNALSAIDTVFIETVDLIN